MKTDFKSIKKPSDVFGNIRSLVLLGGPITSAPATVNKL